MDFDDVIHDTAAVPPGHKMGPPVDGALDAIRYLTALGHHVTICTARGPDLDHIQDWLVYFDFPLLTVTRTKPQADVYLDDKAIRFTTWADYLQTVA